MIDAIGIKQFGVCGTLPLKFITQESVLVPVTKDRYTDQKGTKWNSSTTAKTWGSRTCHPTRFAVFERGMTGNHLCKESSSVSFYEEKSRLPAYVSRQLAFPATATKKGKKDGTATVTLR